MSEHQNNEQAVKKGAGNLAKGATNAVKATKTIIKIFGKLNPFTIKIIGAILLATIVVELIATAMPFGSLFNDATDVTPIEKVREKLDSGYRHVLGSYSTKRLIVNDINDKYGCGASIGNISLNADGQSYTLHNDTCYIKTTFAPEVDEFVNEVDAYANALNGTITILGVIPEEEGSNPLEDELEITEPFMDVDVDNNTSKLTEYGQEIIDEYDNEYVDSHNDKYYQSLAKYANKMFFVEENTEEWSFADIRYGKTVKTVKTETIPSNNKVGGGVRNIYTKIETFDYVDRKYISVDIKEYNSSTQLYGAVVKSSNTEITSWPTKFTDISVYMGCNPKMYKNTSVDTYIAACEEAVLNTEIFRNVFNEETGEFEVKKVVVDETLAKNYVQEIINNYYFNYLSTFNNYSYISGYAGLIDSNGFNYHTFISSNNKAAANLFWAYSLSLNDTLHNLPYANYIYGGFGPVMTKQCTQFAATFFYDVYGFAALRGDGRSMAENLINDCGANSDAPVKFSAATSPAPGAIVSLSPNHVIVVDQVDNDGTIYISEGNINNHNIRVHYKLEGGLAQYEKETGLHVRMIAIPIQTKKGE